MTHLAPNRQAIQTKFLSSTNSRGARVKALAAAGSVTIGWDHRLNPEQNHRAAAEMFANRMNWVGNWISGTLPSDDMVFVNALHELDGLQVPNFLRNFKFGLTH